MLVFSLGGFWTSYVGTICLSLGGHLIFYLLTYLPMDFINEVLVTQVWGLELTWSWMWWKDICIPRVPTVSRELEAREFSETFMSALLMHQWLTVTNKPCFNPDRRLGLILRVALWPSHVHHGTHAPALTRSHSMYTQARYTPTRKTEWKHSPYVLTTFTNLILLYFWTCVVYVFLFEFPHSSYYCFYMPYRVWVFIYAHF